MEFCSAIGLLSIIGAVWVPQSQQTQAGKDVGPGKIYIFKKSDETNKEYYTRILMKHSYENVDKFDVRVQCLKVLLPDLPIWRNDDYLQYITIDNEGENIPSYKLKYVTNIQKGWLESYQSYYTRIFEKHNDEALDEYIERLGVMRTILPSLSCWVDKNYVNYVRPHLEPYKLEAAKFEPGSSSISIVEGNYRNNKNKEQKSSKNSNKDLTEEESVEVKIEHAEGEETKESIENDSENNEKDDMSSKIKEKQYQKRKGESDKEYCKRILGSTKIKGKKSNKLLKKLKKKLDAGDLKIVKKICLKKSVTKKDE